MTRDLEELFAYAKNTGGPDFDNWAETLIYTCRNRDLTVEECKTHIKRWVREVLYWEERQAELETMRQELEHDPRVRIGANVQRDREKERRTK